MFEKQLIRVKWQRAKMRAMRHGCGRWWQSGNTRVRSHRRTFRQSSEISLKKIPRENNSFLFQHTYARTVLRICMCLCSNVRTSKHSSMCTLFSEYHFTTLVAEQMIRNGYHLLLASLLRFFTTEKRRRRRKKITEHQTNSVDINDSYAYKWWCGNLVSFLFGQPK